MAPVAQTSIGVGRPHIRLQDMAIRPEKLLVLANALSLSRGLAALALFILSQAGASTPTLLAVASAMWVTDVLDGVVARRGHKDGARARIDGAALDPLMDDLAFIAGFLILLSAGAVPLWFVAGLLASRVLFALIRITGLANEMPFARSEPVTKFSGAVLAIGQLLLLAHLGFPNMLVGSHWLPIAVIAAMTVVTAYSVVQFAIRKHWRALLRLLAP